MGKKSLSRLGTFIDVGRDGGTYLMPARAMLQTQTCHNPTSQLTAKRNLFDMSVECNPALNFLEKTLLYVYRDRLKGWARALGCVNSPRVQREPI